MSGGSAGSAGSVGSRARCGLGTTTGHDQRGRRVGEERCAGTGHTEALPWFWFAVLVSAPLQGQEVAVKVIPERECERGALRNAVEMAVMATLSHPNIVQVGSGGGGMDGMHMAGGGDGAPAATRTTKAALPHLPTGLFAAAGTSIPIQSSNQVLTISTHMHICTYINNAIMQPFTRRCSLSSPTSAS